MPVHAGYIASQTIAKELSAPRYLKSIIVTPLHSSAPVKHSAAPSAPRCFRRPAITRRLLLGYEKLYKDYGTTHEITISLGLHPTRFDPETEFLPIMKRIVRAASHDVRGIPRRKLPTLKWEDAIWFGGFYEHFNGARELYPHWHGVVSLKAGEEAKLRNCLRVWLIMFVWLFKGLRSFVP